MDLIIVNSVRISLYVFCVKNIPCKRQILIIIILYFSFLPSLDMGHDDLNRTLHPSTHTSTPSPSSGAPSASANAASNATNTVTQVKSSLHPVDLNPMDFIENEVGVGGGGTHNHGHQHAHSNAFGEVGNMVN